MNCRKCINNLICVLFKKSYEIDGAVSLVVSDSDNPMQTIDRNPNIIFDTLADLLPKCCGMFSRNKPVGKFIFLGPIRPTGMMILRFMAQYNIITGHYPTIREICEHVSRSVSTVQEHINKLHFDGYLAKVAPGRRARNYYIRKEAESLIK